MLYHVFNFIDKNESLSPEAKVHYATLARAQLSTYELGLLFYNAVSGEGLGFVDLIKKYGLLGHVDRAILLHERHAEGGAYHHWDAFKGSQERGR